MLPTLTMLLAPHIANTLLLTPVPKLFPNQAAAGFLMDKEIEFLGKLVLHPQKPFFV